MKLIRFTLSATLLTAMLSIVLIGCKSDEKTTEPTTQAAVSPGAMSICTGCGQVKGTAVCCVEGAPDCSGCGLDKGSPGCCTVEKGSTETVALCVCGQIKGTELCCATGQAKCGKCGMMAGSPGCCVVIVE